MPKLWKVATIMALAAIPLLLVTKKKETQPQPEPISSDDNIFDSELRPE
jgi:hypothetical protein